MSEIKPEDFTNAVRDALYVGVGLGVIGFQKAQVRRQELTRSVKGQMGDAKGIVSNLSDTAEDRVKLVEERVAALENQLDQLLDQLEEKLPQQAREMVAQAREVAKDARDQVRSLVNRAA